MLTICLPLTSLDWLDRNLVKAEAMQANVLAKMEDPRYAGFFIRQGAALQERQLPRYQVRG